MSRCTRNPLVPETWRGMDTARPRYGFARFCPTHGLPLLETVSMRHRREELRCPEGHGIDPESERFIVRPVRRVA
jgi:hypothetical protein